MKKQTIKIFTLILSLVLIFSALSNVALASDTYCWYIKRRGRETPIFPPEATLVAEHGGYYIDSRVLSGEAVKRLYLTFDAGYENGNIERILDTLCEKSVPAAFFVLDNLIIKNTALLNRMKEEGHLVCNHTKCHRDLSNASKEEIARDLSELEEIYTEYTGEQMSKYFRFPEGRYSLSALKSIEELGYKTVFWSFAYDDWDNSRQPSHDYAIKKILDNTHDGAIILLHPTSGTNADILSEIIDAWREMGYEFGTLDELASA